MWSQMRDFLDSKFVCIVISSFLYYMILFTTVPIAIQLNYQIVCDNVLPEGQNSPSECNESTHVSSLTSRINLLIGLSQSIPSFLLSGFYASLADKYGRKYALYTSLSGYTVYVSMLLMMAIMRVYRTDHVSLEELYIYSIIGLFSLGCSGSFTTYQMALFAYTADITGSNKQQKIEDGGEGEGETGQQSQQEKELESSSKPSGHRGFIYSLLEASLYFSKTVGPLVSGFYASANGFVGPLVLSLGLCVCCGAFNVFVLKEALEGVYPKVDKSLSWDPFKTFKNMHLLFQCGVKAVDNEYNGSTMGKTDRNVDNPLQKNQKEQEREREESNDKEASTQVSTTDQQISPTYHTPFIIPLLSMAFLFFFITYQGNNEIFILYLKHKFNWNPALIGGYEALESFVTTFGMLVLPFVMKKVTGKFVNTHWLLIGYMIRSLHFYLFTTMTSTKGIYCLVTLLMLAACIVPRSRTLVSNSVAGHMQAKIMSGFTAIQSTGTFMIPIVSLGYSYTVYIDINIMYYVFSVLCACSAGLLAWVVFSISDDGNVGGNVEIENAKTNKGDVDMDTSSAMLRTRLVEPSNENENEY
jgi:MFS family permease